MILIDSWVCEESGSQLWFYKTNASWLESETQEEIPVKINGRILEQRATHWIQQELHPETYIQKNEFGKPELVSTGMESSQDKLQSILPYINYSHTLLFQNNSNSNQPINSNSNSNNPISKKDLGKECWVLWGTHKEKPIGVDVESVRPQIDKIKSKFCRPEEMVFANTSVKTLLIWSAKEAMYKAYGKKEIDFREQMMVHPFVGFTADDQLLDSDKLPESTSELSESTAFSHHTTNSSNSTSRQNSEMQTIHFSGELWGDRHYYFDLYARWYDPFVVVWAVESKSAH